MHEPPEKRRGRIIAFDAAAGVGEVESEGSRLPFHCTAITNGTRVIAPGTEVEFEVVPGGTGRWEAAAISPR